MHNKPDSLKKLIPAVLYLLSILFIQSVNGQAQLNIPDYIRQRFEGYCKSVPGEEIFIHTDREQYISGEDLWFNIYLIDRQTLKPSRHSSIAYFEILNPDNRPVVQKKIFLENGFGPGQIVLPDTLSSGTYSIRAYTNWMKNFLPFNFFLKDIKVYNPYRTKVFRRVVRPAKQNVSSTDTLSANSGLRLEVNNSGRDTLELLIHADEKFRIKNKNLIYLFIQSHGSINHLTPEMITDENTRIALPVDSMPGGINQITIFDSEGPVADRFIYIPFKEKPEVILYSPESCRRREKVILDIVSDTQTNGKAGLTNLSVSVSTATKDTDLIGINDYIIPGSEFGPLPGNLIRGRKFTVLSPPVMDSLMLSLKSNWINWESVFTVKKLLFRYPAENNAHYIQGKLLTSSLQPEVEDEVVIMSTLGRKAAFQYATTDQNGNFSFRENIREDPEDLIIQPDYKLKNQKIYIESPFSDQYLQNIIHIDSTDKLIPSPVLKQSINHQVTKIYGSSFIGDRITRVNNLPESKRFYGKPDFELIMKDYVKLDSMQEVFFELIPHVKLEYLNSAYAISVLDPSGKLLEGAPTVMIDGIIIKDLKVLAKLDPGLVEKIDVIWDKFRVGDYLFNGIINVISKPGDLTAEMLPPDAVRLHSSTIDSVCAFVSPDYTMADIKNSRIADYRNTLYWNPSVRLDKDGKARIEFWSADIKSDYIINLQGITSEGKPFSLSKIIKVQ